MKICNCIHICSIILAITGTWLLAFGLKIKEGISRKLIKELKLDKHPELIVPSDVRQITSLFYSGLILVTIAGVLQIICLFLGQ